MLSGNHININWTVLKMIYEKIHNGHEILFWSICSRRTLWSASDNFLLIDGKLVARSGGICFSSSAKATVLDESRQIPVEMRTKTSYRGPFHLDYELLIGGWLIDSGILRMSFVWNTPQDIEQAILLQRSKTCG